MSNNKNMNKNMNISDCPRDQLQYFIDAHPDCIWKYRVNVPLASGADGDVFSACCYNSKTDNMDCSFVAKVQYNKKNSSNWMDKIQNEVNINKYFYDLGIAIPILDAFACKDHGSYIIMAQREVTVAEYVEKMVDQHISQSIIIKRIDNIEKEVIRLIEIMHSHSYIHDDIHSGNIMLNINKKTGDAQDIVLIDFGKARQVQSPNKSDNEDIRFTFQKLRDGLKSGKKIDNISVYSAVPPTPFKKNIIPPTPFKKNKQPTTPIKRNISMNLNQYQDDMFESPVKINKKLSMMDFDDIPSTP